MGKDAATEHRAHNPCQRTPLSTLDPYNHDRPSRRSTRARSHFPNILDITQRVPFFPPIVVFPGMHYAP